MSIELLWILPIVAVAFVGLLLVLNQQKDSQRAANAALAALPIRDLSKEVAEFNQGLNIDKVLGYNGTENRLLEIENTIKQVSSVLSNQQQIIENYKGKDSKLTEEMDDLRHKLKELQHEYDITISENYTLRARLRRIEEQTGQIVAPPQETANSIPPGHDDASLIQKKTSFFKFDDELQYPKHVDLLEDTSEINMKDITTKSKEPDTVLLPRRVSESTASSYLKDISI
ncbi:MAG: hypothetical protein JW795_02210 [Chitinivibrionales bacterium]|nr:hypothetical protein [Chitinivibrionales bacterium]